MVFHRIIFTIACSLIILCNCTVTKDSLYHETTEDDIINPFINISNAFIPQFDQEYNQVDKLTIFSNNLEIDFDKAIEHPLVSKWIKYFTEYKKEQFERYMNRGIPYKKLVENLLEENGLPKEIYFLAIIESGFRVSARSRANAVGPWQFMRGTGKRFGLQINTYIDERLDPVRSTIAAIRYLKSLHKVFNSWPLAFAAYNSGESRIMNTIIRHSTRDFWKLAELKALPRETRNYLPKFIAAVIVGNHPKKYGFNFEDSDSHPELIAVPFPSPIELKTVSKKLDIDKSILKKFNPHILHAVTPPYKKTYRIWLPHQFTPSDHVLAEFKPLSSGTLAKRFPTHRYRIKRGDSLYSIARKYGTSIRKLKSLNNLRSNLLRIGKTIKIPIQYSSGEYISYKVKKGDNLSIVARKFGASIRQIMRLNSMNHSRIYAGQTLNVPKNNG